MPLQHRPYQQLSDLEQLKALVLGVQAAVAERASFHVGDLIWGMYQNTIFVPEQSIELWQDEAGQLLGFAWCEQPNVVTLELALNVPDSQALGLQMVSWVEQRVQRAVAQGAELPGLWIRPPVHAVDLVSLLQERGYYPDEDYALVLRRDLSAEIPAPALPDGYVVRHVGGEQEWPERVEAHREVWHPSRVTLEAYKRLRAASGYLPELDLVVVAPDGSFAAYCICWLDPANRTGEFEPVGTRPAYRRQGLGQALMREGLRRLRSRGAEAAIVYSVAGNQASRLLYESLGFQHVGRHDFFYKPLASTRSTQA